MKESFPVGEIGMTHIHPINCPCKLCQSLVPKPYHMARLVGQNGEISPWCAKRPRKLNLKKELWTIRLQDVTCARCRTAYREAKGTAA